MAKLFLSGLNNYTTHDEAARAFHRIESAAALELRRDGSASIAFLSRVAPQSGQPEYVGTAPRFNEAADAERAA